MSSTRAVLADAGPLYAVAIPSDQYHQRSRGEMERITRERLRVFVPVAVLLETYTLILRRVAPPNAHQWLKQLVQRTTLVHPTQDDYLESMQRVERYRDQPLTLFDTVLVVVSERLDVPIWSYDHHVDIMAARRWPGYE